jgi:hypothetical protein
MVDIPISVVLVMLVLFRILSITMSSQAHQSAAAYTEASTKHSFYSVPGQQFLSLTHRIKQ